MKQTITFKNYVRSGRFASFQPKGADIKLNGNKIGWMTEHTFGVVEVRFHVKKEPTKDDPAPFRNVRLNARFSSIDEAKKAIKASFKQLAEKLDIYQHEN